LLFATGLPRPISNDAWGSNLDTLSRFGWDGSARRQKTNEQR
jgi:hypothetical protein